MVENGVGGTVQKETPDNKNYGQEKKNRHENDACPFNAVPDVPVTDKPAQDPDEEGGGGNGNTDPADYRGRVGELQKLVEKEPLGVAAP